MGKEIMKQTKFDKQASRILNAGIAALGKRKPKVRVVDPGETSKVTNAAYSPAFWERAKELLDSPKKCESCHQLNNPKARPSVVVRLVLVGDGTPLPHQLRLLCGACFAHPGRKFYLRKKEVLACVGDLFEHLPEKG